MLGRIIQINYFNWQRGIKSSLAFLRRPPWARRKVAQLYLDTLPDFQRGGAAAESASNAG